jgi:hypothetical protein
MDCIRSRSTISLLDSGPGHSVFMLGADGSAVKWWKSSPIEMFVISVIAVESSHVQSYLSLRYLLTCQVSPIWLGRSCQGTFLSASAISKHEQGLTFNYSTVLQNSWRFEVNNVYTHDWKVVGTSLDNEIVHSCEENTLIGSITSSMP